MNVRELWIALGQLVNENAGDQPVNIALPIKDGSIITEITGLTVGVEDEIILLVEEF